MRVSQSIGCREFTCADVRHECYVVPDIDLQPDAVSLVMISEAAPPDSGDHYYADGEPLFQQTTLLAFQDAGAQVSSIQDILQMGVYLTTAVKCGKTGYGIKANTIQECSLILEKELARRYPGIKFVNYHTFGSTHGGDEAKSIAALPQKLKENRCDAVISGVGC